MDFRGYFKNFDNKKSTTKKSTNKFDKILGKKKLKISIKKFHQEN